MQYPHRSEAQQAALDHLSKSPYAQIDQPFLFTSRYSVNHFEPADIRDKITVDEQGVQDNAYWHEVNQQQRLGGMF